MILETSKTQRNTNTYLTTVMGQLFSSFSYVVHVNVEKKKNQACKHAPF